MKILIIIISCLISLSGNSQDARELSELKSQVHSRQHEYTRLTKGNTNEVQILFSGLFLFYKTFISSQDNSACSFSPSCSEYGMIAVRKKGVLKGMLLTFDRLTRCNGLNKKKYTVDPSNGLLSDPI